MVNLDDVNECLDTGERVDADVILAMSRELSKLRAENLHQAEVIRRLEAFIDTPQTADFIEAVRAEAAHQRKRWPSEHDAGKTDADWFWLIGYLGGKALATPTDRNEKQLHRIITVAAACANWHAAKLGHTNMRPGIATPAGALDDAGKDGK